MTDVFISRPTWVAPNFRAGLDGFLGSLKSLGLNPRTIGSTDYPSKAPLDEVIRLMERCAGAVILGYPQIVVASGSVKDTPLSSPLMLPTEWNHIEAGLAYARGLPLLVIHHRGVSRGIFDRGALSSFVYELNLEEAAWPLSERVRGAVETWKRDVLDGPRLIRPTSGPPETAEPSRPALASEHIAVLKFMAQRDAQLAAEDVSRLLNVPVQKARYYVDQLTEWNYIGASRAIGRPALYYLSRDGRALLVERGVL